MWIILPSFGIELALQNKTHAYFTTRVVCTMNEMH